MSVVEQQAKELCVDTARGTECRGQEADAAVIGISGLVLRNFFPGRFLERLVDVGRVTQLVHLVRIVRVSPPLVREGEVED